MERQLAKLLNDANRLGVKDDNLADVIRDYFIDSKVSVILCDVIMYVYIF